MGGPWRRVRVLVDTGAYLTVLSRRTLRGLGITPLGKETFRIGNGQVIEREVGHVWVRYHGRLAPTQVVFAGPGDVLVLGALALEELYLRVDPKARRLEVRKEVPLMPLLPASHVP